VAVEHHEVMQAVEAVAVAEHKQMQRLLLVLEHLTK
jgi:hypothetical protein